MSAQERTGWRDERISRFHRFWGDDCPVVDIDFLVNEYESGKARALVEYKHERCGSVYFGHRSYLALKDLADRAKVPFFCCIYSNDLRIYNVTPLNRIARFWVESSIQMTLIEWVTLLYEVRFLEVPSKVLVMLEQCRRELVASFSEHISCPSPGLFMPETTKGESADSTSRSVSARLNAAAAGVL